MEYAKWSISQQPNVVDNWNRYFLQASRVCFVDKKDKQSAIEKSEIIASYKNLNKIAEIPIPTTIEKLKFDQLSHLNNREPHFLCFGIIRPYKGIENFALPLAKEFTRTNRKVIIVGSIPLDRPNPKFLANMFFQAYGENKEIREALNQITENSEDLNTKVIQLISLYDSKLKFLKPDINVEFHFNIEEEQLASLFNRCRYALNFNNKGVSPHFSGVTNTLMAHMKNYGLDLYMTFEPFREGGEYSFLSKVFKVEVDDPGEDPIPKQAIEHIAQAILTDVEQIELDPLYEEKFAVELQQFTAKYPLQLETISARFDDIYQQEIQKQCSASQNSGPQNTKYRFYTLPPESNPEDKKNTPFVSLNADKLLGAKH